MASRFNFPRHALSLFINDPALSIDVLRGCTVSNRRPFTLLITMISVLLTSLTPWAAVVLAEPVEPGIPLHRVFLPFIVQVQAPVPPADDWKAQSSVEYTVQPGDTWASIAIDFGRDVSGMRCATQSSITDPNLLQVGMTLTIPSLGTACHIVREGDTLDSIASFYAVPVAAIVDNAWNHISSLPYELQPGQRLRVTGALDPRFMPLLATKPREVVPTPTPASATVTTTIAATATLVYGDGRFVWPLHGSITQEASAGHRAVDVAANLGDVIVAADTGTVIKAGWNDQGLGYRIVIDHHIDYVTLYGHLSALLVKEGDVVQKGQPIGLAGSTGNSTGVHLHFAIWDYGVATNPLDLLPPQ